MKMSFTIKDTHSYLDSLLVFGVKLGLKNMEAMCELLDNPQKSLEFIHVAGTNGKGSVCSMLAASLKNCGLKTGFYSSPYLCNFNERWRINGIEVDDEDVSSAVKQISDIEESLVEKTGVRPTYFEVLTAVALLIFKKHNADIVVWETGLGGRLDATNVVHPLVSVITNVELDHTEYLGETFLDIAYEKGGIVKRGVPFVCGEHKVEVVNYFKQLSSSLNAPSVFAADYCAEGEPLLYADGRCIRNVKYRSSSKSVSVKINDPGLYQIQNVGVALATLEKLEELKSWNFEKMTQGLEKFRWPGRLEVRENGMILDGAHNPKGALAVVESLKELRPGIKLHFICGILKDKNWKEVVRIFSELADSFYFVTLQNERSSDADHLKEYAESLDIKVSGCGNSAEALDEAKKRPEQTVAVGSLYLIGELLSLLQEGKPLLIDSLT